MGGIKRRVLILRAVSFERYFLYYRGKKGPSQPFRFSLYKCQGNTATREYGVGMGKRKFMRKEHGESVRLMRQIR